MVGFIIILLITLYAFYRWKRGDKVTFYLIVFYFMDRCYHFTLFTHTPWVRCDDIALIMVIISCYLARKKRLQDNIKITNKVRLFLFFLGVSCIVSLIVFRLPVIQVFKGVRGYLFLLVIFDVITLTRSDIEELLYKVFVLNVFFSAVFILHSFVPNLNILDDSVYKIGFLGLPRFWATPALLVYSCLYSVFLFDKTTTKRILYTILPFAALILAQSRGQILYTGVMIFGGFFFFDSSMSKKMLYVFFGGLFLILSDSIFSGDIGDKTNRDLEMITSGNIVEATERNDIEGDATLSYRCWITLRNLNRVNDGDFYNKLFGLGFFVDIDNEKAEELNLSDICNIRIEDCRRTLYTPDIAYANTIVYLGYIGMLLYYGMFVSLYRFYRKYTDNSIYARLGVLYILFIVFSGLNSSFGTYANCLVMPILIMQVLVLDINKNNTYNESYTY